MDLSKLRLGVLGVGCAMVAWVGASPAWGQCIPPPAGLVSWWPGDLDGTDIVGGNDAVLLGDTIAGAPGKVGGAWDFDGVGDYARVADSPAVSIESGDGTWLAWVLPRQANTTLNFRQVIFDKEASLNGGVFLYLQRNALRFYNGSPQVGQLPILNGVWYLIAVVKDGFIGRTYVNGVLDLTFPWLPFSGGQDLGIGGDTLGTAINPQEPRRRFNGKIDEAMIFNRALLPAEISAIYAARNTGVCVDTDFDGVLDDEDACPDSTLTATIIIDGCDTGVDNMLFDDGCTMADLIAECGDGASNHGAFVRCVQQLNKDWQDARLISRREKVAIQNCATQANIPVGPLDCNDNGIFDDLDLEDGTSADCNGNGVPDECDIAGGVPDCNVNGIPDTCEQFPTVLAENTTGFPDFIYTGPPDDSHIGIGGQIVTYDFGDNGVIDGEGPDFNIYEVDFGVPEFAIIDVLVSVDGTSYISVKDTEAPVVHIPGDEMHSNAAFARSYDLSAIVPNAVRFIRIDGVGNGAAGGNNGFDLDAIGEINFFAFQVCGCPWDLNGDGIVDESDLGAVVNNLGPCADPNHCAWDVNGDGVVDGSDVAAVATNFGPCSLFLDCNGNGIFDDLDLENGTSADCNGNGVPDECDIAGGVPDCNGNGIPDTCDQLQFPTVLAENTTGFPDSTYTGPPDDFHIGIGGQIVTYDFGDNHVIDGGGPDFNIYEVDFGGAEFAIIDVLVSVDGTSYISVKDTEGPVVHIPGDEMHSNAAFARSYDLSAIVPNAVRFIRIDGVGNGAAGGNNGFDLDAIGAINFACP